KPKLEYKILTPEYIMSSVYKVYGNEKLGFWVGKIILTNTGKAPAYDVKLTYKIEGCTDWSEAPQAYPVINPGSTIVDLYYPILSNEITKLSASTPSNLKIKITYAERPEGKTKEIDESKSINILGGHDFIFSSIPPEESVGNFYDIFSNYPLLAAWVTPTDPPLRGFSDL
ncbi:MAG: cysteine protease, partial [Candidatus Nealsonbacteria bacterium CG23_combo_of_CG06-09_8_20_14_all_38_19]